jgi:hypothetical protein
MNKLLIDTVRSPLRHIAAATLVVLSAGLAVSALAARTPSPSPARGEQCINWPCKDGDPNCTQTFKDSVAQVFTDLINKASDGTQQGAELRQQLLDPNHCWRTAHDIVRARLKDIVPFGPEHTVIFYEPESYDSVQASPSGPVFPAPNHCIHILYLDKPKAGVTRGSFHDNLMCCYKPW